MDLGSRQAVDTVRLNWETAAARNYLIQVSDDGVTWNTVKTITGNTASGPVTFAGLGAHGRYVRINCSARATPWGYSLYELQVYGKR